MKYLLMKQSALILLFFEELEIDLEDDAEFGKNDIHFGLKDDTEIDLEYNAEFGKNAVRFGLKDDTEIDLEDDAEFGKNDGLEMDDAEVDVKGEDGPEIG